MLQQNFWLNLIIFGVNSYSHEIMLVLNFGHLEVLILDLLNFVTVFHDFKLFKYRLYYHNNIFAPWKSSTKSNKAVEFINPPRGDFRDKSLLHIIDLRKMLYFILHDNSEEN